GTRRITAMVGALTVGAALLVPGLGLGIAGARPARTAPPVTVSTTDLAIGTDLTVSGTGCGGESAADHTVAIGLADPDRPETLQFPEFNLGLTAVPADGSWTFATTVAQPLPPGRWLLVAGCRATVDLALEFAYEPVEVTNTPQPVTGIVVDGDVLSIDNPCRVQTSSPPWGPEISAYLFSPTTSMVDYVALDSITAISTGTARASFRVPASVRSGTYLLEVRCLRHRISEPAAIFATTIDWAAAPTSVATTTTVGGNPRPGPAAPAPPVHGSPTYTG
ncbi:MAG: hypothetical protein ABIP03_13755, partial [Aquihabitans sp.]